MKSSEKIALILLALLTIFKGIVWASLVPIWHIPDEQAHFAQVQYYAEFKKEVGGGNNLSQEIFESERLLGTLRDGRGINKFTYHPEYRIKYSENLIGVYEKDISSLGKETRTTLVKAEAARYPPLFYIISSIGYFAGYSKDLFTRLFLTRLISVIIAVATVWAAYRLAKEICPKSELFALTVASLVSFQPMFSFLSSGANNDNLLNLLSTILLWLMVKTFREGLTLRLSVLMGIVTGLGIITKQLIYPFIPLPVLVIVFDISKRKVNIKDSVKKLTPFLIGFIFFGGYFIVSHLLKARSLPYWPQVTPDSPKYYFSFSKYLSEKIPVLYRETLPWYWGVFNWLGVVLPLPILRTIKVVMGISFIGLIRYIIQKIRKFKLTVTDWQLIFLLFSSLWFAFWLIFWDYSLIRSIGFSHGIQGRNFFPVISAHLTLLTFGFWSLAETKKELVVKVVVIAMVLLNFSALKTLISSYYDTSSINMLITQASQYKPWFFKGVGLIFWFSAYLASLTLFIKQYLSLKGGNK